MESLPIVRGYNHTKSSRMTIRFMFALCKDQSIKVLILSVDSCRERDHNYSTLQLETKKKKDNRIGHELRSNCNIVLELTRLGSCRLAIVNVVLGAEEEVD